MVQRAVYKMSCAGSFIDEGDFSQALAVLGSSAGIDWVKDLKAATVKVGQKSIASASKIRVEMTAMNTIGKNFSQLKLHPK